MNPPPKYPSFWSGLGAARYPFKERSDYAWWACRLIERGHRSTNICILAGVGEGDNRFEIEQWHRQALRELGYADVSERAAMLAHLRGYAEEFLEGQRDFLEVLQYFANLKQSEDEELLEKLESLHFCYWDFEYVDLSKEGINSLDDFPKACAAACADLIQTIQAEQEATGLPTREPVGPGAPV